MRWHGGGGGGGEGGTEGIRGHVWGTCCGNRYMRMEGEVKAEGRSCSCLEGFIYANNKRKEVKSRNWPRATVICVLQSAMHVSLTVRIIGVCTSKTQQSSFRFPALFLFLGYRWRDQHSKHAARSSRRAHKSCDFFIQLAKTEVTHSGLRADKAIDE